MNKTSMTPVESLRYEIINMVEEMNEPSMARELQSHHFGLKSLQTIEALEGIKARILTLPTNEYWASIKERRYAKMPYLLRGEKF